MPNSYMKKPSQFKIRTTLTVCCLILLLSAPAQTVNELLDQADTLFYRGNFKVSLALSVKADSIVLREYGSASKLHGKVLGLYYGMNYENMGKRDSAVFYYQAALDIYRAKKERPDSDYANILVNFGNFYNIRMQKPSMAKPLFEEADTLLDQVIRPESLDYSASLNNLGLYYYSTGAYSKAEENYRKCLNNLLRYHKDKYDNILLVKVNQTELYKSLGMLKKAFYSLGSYLDLYKKKPSPSNIILLASYMQYCDLGLSSIADFSPGTVNKNLDAMKAGYHDTNQINAAILFNNIKYNVMNRKFDVALKRYDSVLKKGLQKYFTGEGRMFDVSFMIPDALIQAGRLKEAAVFTDSVIAGYIKSGSGDNIRYWNMMQQLFNIHLLDSNYAKARSILIELNKDIYHHENYYLSGLPENVKTSMATQIRNCVKATASYFDVTKKTDNELVQGLLNNELNLKALIMNENKVYQNFIRKSKSPIAADTAKALSDLRLTIARIYLQGRKKKSKLLDSLIDRESYLDQQLRNMVGLKKKDSIQFDWRSLQKTLKPGNCIIDFISYTVTKSVYKLVPEVHYGAVVLCAGDTSPVFLPLCTEMQIRELIQAASANSDTISIANLCNDKVMLKRQVVQPLNYLYRLVWKKLESRIRGYDTVFFIPNGILNILPFDAFQDENGNYLAKRKQVIQRLLSFDFLKYQKQVPMQTENYNAEIWGNIDYGGSAKGRSLTKGSEKMPFAPLNSVEVTQVKSLLSSHRINNKVYSRKIASELAFKRMAHNSRLLHLSTHGFYSPGLNAEEIKNKMHNAGREVPYTTFLLKSGIALAGANNAITGKTYKNINQEGEDGTLYSYEIKDLDLSSVDLAVLSACETGLGKIVYDEGIAGLQYAFKLAGVNKIIMSLWKLSKDETAEWMKYFYERYSENQDAEDAFRKTQVYMSAHSAAYRWAGFIMVK